MPPVSHVIYIPMILLVGIVLGFILANRLSTPPPSPKKKTPTFQTKDEKKIEEQKK